MRVGHWTAPGTGVTVVVPPGGTIGAVEVRGGAPATRETDLLGPGCLVRRVDAVVLSGGSAFGLAAADGVAAALAEQGTGFPTRGGPVPIVPAAALYDLADGVPRPGPAEGRAALADAARGRRARSGRVGAGTGATVGKWRGADHSVPGGTGTASARVDAAVVGALAAVNAVGDVVAADGRVLAGSTAPRRTPAFPTPDPLPALGATTLVVVATDAALSWEECLLLARSAHTGLARALHPSHTRHDGDLAFALSTGAVPGAHVERLRAVAADVVAAAIRASVAGPGGPGRGGRRGR